MREYDLPIIVTNHGPAASAQLKVIRLPTSWYAVVWESPKRYASFSQDRTELNGGHEHLSDNDFLGRVRLVASFAHGIDFDYSEVL
ncbi:hypothetical protein EDE05_117105 [Neorhizobium sp. R1-B]|uniref:hypothetical protein n=1 Tax=Neorhizobium sp. R1-B TaxID=2485162 RepID=UPI001064B677|nr:hypothetical protein [Neorhizobium sp. R1-B]TDX76223.1 hypothetical protein EDE05_117105 [Neorhizobium sp. R1-B]